MELEQVSRAERCLLLLWSCVRASWQLVPYIRGRGNVEAKDCLRLIAPTTDKFRLCSLLARCATLPNGNLGTTARRSTLPVMQIDCTYCKLMH